MTNLKLLKAKMLLAGYEEFTNDLEKILGISHGTASKKANGKSDFSQKEISILSEALSLTGDDIKAIFTSG